MSTLIILAGNTVGAEVTFTPREGVVVPLENVTAWSYEHKTNSKVPLSGITEVSPNVFYAEVPISDGAVGGLWTVRFESSDPKIAEEETWLVDPSTVPSP